MTRWAMLAAAALAVGAGAAEARGWGPPPEALVEGWYRQYLGRCADPSGLCGWAKQLRCGKSPEAVLGAILGSDEYFRRHGCCDAGFIQGLYKDHLGRCASPGEVRDWLCQLGRCHSREKLAVKFLCAARLELSLR